MAIPSTVHSLVGVALGLLLVFRTNASYDRFWEGRRLWGGIVNETRNLARAAARVPAKDDPDAVRRARRAGRWRFAYAAMHQLRGDGRASARSTTGCRRARSRPCSAAQHVPLAVATRISRRC